MPTEENPGKPAGADASAKAEPADKLTPAEWAERKGIAPKAVHPWEEAVSKDWRYPAAAQLHGWTHEAFHYQAAPFQILEKDFDAALEAAAQYPVKPAHEGAVAPHAPFKPQFVADNKAREEAAAEAKKAEEAKKQERR
jgi:hypothetical protein